MSNNTFEGKTIIITGASAGIGKACSDVFADAGANLVLVARNEKTLNEVAGELREKTKVLTVAMDVASVDDCINLMEKAAAEFGRIDVLVNNAGMHSRGDVIKKEPTQIAAMVDINLRAPLVLTTAILPYLKEAGGGAIVNVASLAGRAPLQGAATYSATKSGLRMFTYSIADELRGSGIYVGAVSPGPVDTGFIMAEMDDVEDIVFSQPMSTAKEVADAVVSLALGEKIEICMPANTGFLTTLAYLFPALRRTLRPSLYKKGRKNKEKYRKRYS